MAANDILVRLIMDANGYNRDLSKSQQKTKEFEKNLREKIGGAAATFTKMTTAIGVSMTAFEALEKSIKSSKSTYEAFTKMTDQAKAGIDSFFMTIGSNGSFSNFISNLDNVVTKAGNLADIMAKLKNTNLFGGYQMNVVESQISELLSKSKDTRYSESERKAYAAQAEALKNNLVAVTGSVAGVNKAAAYEMVRAEMAKLGMTGTISDQQIESLLNMSGSQRKSMGDYYGNLYKAANTTYTTMVAGVPAKQRLGEYESTFAGQSAKGAYYLNQMDDSEGSVLSKAIQMNEQAASLNAKVASINQQISEAGNSLNNISKASGGGKAVAGITYGEGSIGAINQQITALEQSYIQASDDGTRIGIRQAINKLEAQKESITLYTEFMASGGVQTPGLSTPGISLPDTSKIVSPFKAADVQTNNEFAESLAAISTAMGNVAGMTGEGAAAWLTWGANLMSAIAQALPAISTLIAAKTAEGAISAGASAAETPLVGWLLAGGAIAAFLAAAAAVPKFAEGGVVGGASFIGDKNLAALNTGEMILNGTQQAKLFNMINAGGIGAGGEVEFRIKGQELYGVLQNYENKRSKAR